MNLTIPLWMDVLTSLENKNSSVVKIALEAKASYFHTLKTIKYMQKLGILKLDKHGREGRVTILDQELVDMCYKIKSRLCEHDRNSYCDE